MNEITVAQIKSWDPKQRAAELKLALSDTAMSLLKAAKIIRVMVDLEENIHEYPRQWIKSMLKVGTGDILPEVMLNFDGMARQHIIRMPIDEQRKLCENPTVEVVNPMNMQVVKERVQNLDPRGIRQAFDYDRLRSVKDQRQLLQSPTLRDMKHEPEDQPSTKTFADAVEFFERSRKVFGHLKELTSIYQMVSVCRQRLNRGK